MVPWSPGKVLAVLTAYFTRSGKWKVEPLWFDWVPHSWLSSNQNACWRSLTNSFEFAYVCLYNILPWTLLYFPFYIVIIECVHTLVLYLNALLISTLRKLLFLSDFVNFNMLFFLLICLLSLKFYVFISTCLLYIIIASRISDKEKGKRWDKIIKRGNVIHNILIDVLKLLSSPQVIYFSFLKWKN